MMRFWSSLLVAMLLVTVGCQKDLTTPQGTVEEFLDQQYVNVDLKKSKTYTIGLAREKVDDEIRLTTNQKIDDSTRKPKIYYALIEKRNSRDRLSYLYELTIHPEDADEFKRRVLVWVQQNGDGWRISNFSEY